MQNKYLCYWNTEDFITGGMELHTTDFFTEDNGYGKEDIKAILNLKVGEVWFGDTHEPDEIIIPTGTISHAIVRVTDNTEI